MSPELTLAAIVVVTALFWFAPAIIAGRRRIAAQYGILAILLFTPFLVFAGPVGWLLVAIAWIVAIVWSLTGASARHGDRAAA